MRAEMRCQISWSVEVLVILEMDEGKYRWLDSYCLD